MQGEEKIALLNLLAHLPLGRSESRDRIETIIWLIPKLEVWSRLTFFYNFFFFCCSRCSHSLDSVSLFIPSMQNVRNPSVCSSCPPTITSFQWIWALLTGRWGGGGGGLLDLAFRLLMLSYFIATKGSLPERSGPLLSGSMNLWPRRVDVSSKLEKRTFYETELIFSSYQPWISMKASCLGQNIA